MGIGVPTFSRLALALPWVHRVFANAKRWGPGVYHGLRRRHLQAYLDEFAFRFNRRRWLIPLAPVAL